MNNNIITGQIIRPCFEVEQTRQRVDQGLREAQGQLLAIVGPCAAREVDLEIIRDEGHDIDLVPRVVNDLTTLHRLPIWKPRSNKEDWHGEETTNAEGALTLIEEQSKLYGSVAIELGFKEHLAQYIHLLSFAWIGARSENDINLKLAAAAFDPSLPLGVKNGLNGLIDSVLKSIERMRAERSKDDAQIVLVFRGGTEARDPDAWERDYLEALEATSGKLIVDVAHGGEMAHDPAQNFQKTVLGQIACMNHVIELAKSGHAPAGIMIEASGAASVTDPVIPFATAIEGVIELKNNIQSAN